MNWRGVILLCLIGLTGCQGAGTSRVPPPNPMGQPNAYYQPPAQTPAFTAPGYGAPATGAVTPPPGFGQTQPLGTNPVSFAPGGTTNAMAGTATSSDGLSWQSPVTKQPTISRNPATPGAINPQTTLTTIRNPSTTTGSTNPFVNANGQPLDIAQLPRVNTTQPAGTSAAGTPAILSMPPPPGYGTATTPTFSQPIYGGTANSSDPWRGR